MSAGAGGAAGVGGKSVRTSVHDGAGSDEVVRRAFYEKDAEEYLGELKPHLLLCP